MRRGLTRKGHALLLAGTLCLSLGAAAAALLPAVVGPDPGLVHFAQGVLIGLGATLNIGGWFVGRARPTR